MRRRNLILWLLILCPVLLSAGSPERSFSVRGYGLFGNRSLERMVPLLSIGEERREVTFRHDFLENLLILVHARIESEGYLQPRYRIEFESLTGESATMEWNGREWLDLPMQWEPNVIRLRLDKGTFHYYDKLRIDAGEDHDLSDATRFFHPVGFLFQTRRYRPFSAAGMRSGVNNLLDDIRQRGFRDARLVRMDYDVADGSGAVVVDIEIAPGALHRLRELRWEISGVGEGADEPPLLPVGRHPELSAALLRDKVRDAIHRFYERGFADVRTRTRIDPVEEVGNELYCDVIIEIETGPEVVTGVIHLEGQGSTLDSVLERRIDIESGDPMDPLIIEQSRSRIGRLGIFSRISTETEVVEGDERREKRNLTFAFEEGKRMDMSLLLGYSTYERVRGGFEVSRANLWGRAHRDRVRLIQSFKSSSGLYTYTMPEFFGEELGVALEGYALVRDELSFRRQEWGGEVRLTKEFGTRSQATMGYRLERLDSRRFEVVEDTRGRTQSRVGSLQFSFSRDTRDNPLYPSRGTQWRAEAEFGALWFGADVTYQRFNFQHSRHYTLRRGLRLHGRIAHGFAATWGSNEDNLPINRRFYPGGVHSIRGFRPGQASPVDSAGQYTGAEVYLLGQVELEQDLSPSLAGVVFIDHLRFARDLDEWPGDESLTTVGVGLRYRTIIGPLRIEAGRNVQRREIDPSMAVQISLGFPF